MNDEAVVETDDVQVRKSFNAEDFPVPAVTFEVTSNREDDVTVRIVDEIPEEFGIDQIGFHPDYDSDCWTATGDGVVRFERTVEAGDSFTTVYGVRLDGEEEPDPFLTPPGVEVGDGLDDVVPPESTQVVRDLVSGERDSVPGLDGEEPSYEDDEIIEAPAGPAAAVSSGIEDLEAEAAAGSGDATDDDHLIDDAEATVAKTDGAPASTTTEADTAVPPSSNDDPVAALAEAIRTGDADDDDLAVIREELGVPEDSPSTDVKLDHLQARVSDLEAYTDALEEFIDENGTAEQLLRAVETDVDEVRETVDTVDDRVETLEAENEALRTNLEDYEAELERVESELEGLDSLEADLDRLAGDLDALDERVADVEEVGLDLNALEDDVEAVREDVEALDEWKSQLTNVLGS